MLLERSERWTGISFIPINSSKQFRNTLPSFSSLSANNEAFCKQQWGSAKVWTLIGMECVTVPNVSLS